MSCAQISYLLDTTVWIRASSSLPRFCGQQSKYQSCDMCIRHKGWPSLTKVLCNRPKDEVTAWSPSAANFFDITLISAMIEVVASLMTLWVLLRE